MVILERNGTGFNRAAIPKNRIVKKITAHGVLMAFLGMLGQAIGYILSKVGMLSDRKNSIRSPPPPSGSSPELWA